MKTRRNIRWLLLRRDTTGAALVEFTLLAPFLIFLGLGMSEFGRFLYQYQLVLDGVRDGARYLARLPDPNNTTSQDQAKCLVITGSPAMTGSACSGTERVEGWAASDVTFNIGTINNSTGTYRGEATLYTVQASSTFNYEDLGFLSALGLSSISVAATHMQRAIEE